MRRRGFGRPGAAGLGPGLLVVLLFPGALDAAAGEGPVALQTADASCRDASGNTYVDCGNGTVTDNRTGLIWLQDADCVGTVTWKTAIEFVAGLSDLETAADCGLSDNSSPGEWRLPSKAEWEAMVADADGGPGELDCDPAITDDQGNACWDPSCVTGGNCAFTGVASAQYWSGTTVTTVPANAWIVILSSGFTPNAPKDLPRRIWPVRGGQ